jgi:hypothetical protein
VVGGGGGDGGGIFVDILLRQVFVFLFLTLSSEPLKQFNGNSSMSSSKLLQQLQILIFKTKCNFLIK